MDIKTLLLALALGNLSLCLALWFSITAARPGAAPARVRGLGGLGGLGGMGEPGGPGATLWLLAKACQAGAWLLLYWRGAIPDLISILLANALLFAGVACDAAALWQLAGRSAWRRWLAPLLALAAGAFLACYLFNVGAPLRGAAGALIVSAFLALGVVALARRWDGDAQPGAGGSAALRRYLVLAMSALTAVLLLRSVMAVAQPQGWHWLTPEWLQQASFIALYLMMLCNGFGYLLLSRQQLQRELARLAIVDAVTGAPNRRGFDQALAPWLALARRPGPATALIVLNIDHFKRVNDAYGYPVGDALLKSVVLVCGGQLRDSDRLGRLGGAEFAIQLPRTALPDALMVAERIRAAIAAAPFKTERAVIALTASLGVTVLRAEDSMVSLYARADTALQAAKAAGRNQVAQALADAPATLADQVD